MSKAHKDKSNVPIRSYLARSLAAAKLSGSELSILLLIMESTYGWMMPGQNDKSVRLDRARFDVQEIAEAVGLSYRSASGAVRSLVARGILFEYDKATKIMPGLFGLNSDPRSWKNPPLEAQIERLKSPRKFKDDWKKTSTQVGNDWKKTSTQVGNDWKKTSTQNGATSHEGRRKAASNHKDLNHKESNHEDPYSPHEKKSFSFADLEAKDFDADGAIEFIREAYFKTFGMKLSFRDSEAVRDFLDIGPLNNMAWFFCKALRSALLDREKRSANPEKARFVARSPFKDVEHFAARFYQKGKKNLPRTRSLSSS